MENTVFLSLCIPTYNRATYLKRCLESIVKQVGNNNEVEIIISDNVSDDDTSTIGAYFEKNFTNVKYFRNDTNIGGDRNFIQALKRGNGQYLKLLNDYIEYKDGCALKMLQIVKDFSKNREIIFFANGVSYLKKREFHYSENLDEFLPICSFHSQWISTIGFWREDFETMIGYYQFKTKSFYQTELLFENFALGKKAVTYSRQIYISHPVQNKKIAFNFFDTFINGYFNTIIRGLKKEKKIADSTYKKEENRFFSEWVFSWYKKVRLKKNHNSEIDGRGAESIIFNTFKYSPIFYLHLLYLPFYLIGFYFKKLIGYYKPAGQS